jgi:hypothetical protein
MTASFFLIVFGTAAWFVLLRPEAVSQETLTSDFAAHRQAYEAIASYLTERKITTEITDIPIAGQKYEGVSNDGTDAYGAFMEAIYEIMEEDHDRIVSDGEHVEFIYHSTGGLLNAKNGSVIYASEESVLYQDTLPLNAENWHLYLAKP